MKKLGRMVALILTFSLLLASSAFAATKASSQILKHSIDNALEVLLGEALAKTWANRYNKNTDIVL